MTTQYQLNTSTIDWPSVMMSAINKLPQGIQPTHTEALERLPIFAVILVLSEKILDSYHKNHELHPDALMRIWAEEDGWSVIPIKEKAQTPTTLRAKKEVSPLTKVSVHRYVVMPSQASLITEDKREVIAHLLDDKITAYLKRKLSPNTQSTLDLSDLASLEAIDNFEPKKSKGELDCHILSISQMLRRHKLACFDMDSTLIKQEVIVELAKIAGVGDEVNEITEQAMRGEIDFATSFAKRVALLKGLDEKVIDQVCQLLIPQAGAFATIAALKALGYRCVLISGGFVPFASYIAKLLGMDDYFANELDVENAKLTGELVFPILDGKQKAIIVQRIAKEMGIALDEVVCIGDGANDLPMFEVADLGLAYHAKPIVQAKADAAINITGLEGVLYALGHPVLVPIDTDS